MNETNYDGVWIIFLCVIFAIFILFFILVVISSFLKDKSNYPLKKGKFDESNGYSRKSRVTQYDIYNRNRMHSSDVKKGNKY